MQRKNQFHKSCYFSIYSFNLKLPLLLIICLLLIGCARNDSGQSTVSQSPNSTSENTININNANAAELEKLPHIGAETARKIIKYREKYGRFRRAENLILVDGMSDKKFRDLRNSVKVE